MTDYVMFGHSPLFGDVVEMIQANGGRLKKVVQNIPEEVRPGTKPLAELIAQQERVSRERIAIQQLTEFEPEVGEQYVIGFRGHHLIPLRSQLRERFGLSFPSLIHPRAIVSPTAHFGEGTFIAAGAIVGAGCAVGRFALLNRGCTIGHDCLLGDFTNVGPGADLASFVRLERCAVIGIGAAIINWVKVGAHAVVAAGAVVTDEVAEHTLVAGVPAVAKKSINLNPGPDNLD